MRLISAAHAPITDGIAMIELDGLVRGARIVDDLLKAASVRIIASEVYSGPRHAVLFDGPLEDLGLAYDAGLAAGGDRVVDSVLLPAAQPSLVRALAGSFEAPEQDDAAILLVEFETIASTLRAVDAALKVAPLNLSAWRLGQGIAGRALFALRGEHANLEAARDEIEVVAGAALMEQQLIPRPDPLGLWARPFGRGGSTP